MPTRFFRFRTGEAFRLADRVVTPDANEIDGARIDPKTMDVLVALVEAAPDVVSGQALLDRVWPDVVVVPNVVYQAIAQLRKALGDEPRAPRYVETIPRRGYRVIAEIVGTASDDDARIGHSAPTADVLPNDTISSAPLLAVLPFDNQSDDPHLLYFSDGISEEILHAVAKTLGIRTIGRSSSFQFRGTDKAARRVAAALNATHVLDGTVRRSGTRVRISAQLVECASEVSLWSDCFDRELSDVFALQDEIAGAVAGALKSAFTPIPRSQSIDPALYVLYLRAHALVQDSTEAKEFTQALEMLERVVAFAPTFARGWAALANVRATCLRMHRKRLPGTDRLGVLEAAETALKLDPTLGGAYQSLAALEPFGCYAEREALHRKALAIAPNDSRVLTAAGALCAVVGRLREGLDYAKRALDLDPMHMPAANWYASMIDAVGRYDESKPVWNDILAQWREVEFVAIDAIAAAAHSCDWQRFDALVTRSRELGFRSQSLITLVRYYANLRTTEPHYSTELLGIACKSLDKKGTVPLNLLCGLYALGLREEAFKLAKEASFSHMFDPDGASPNGRSGITPAIIFFHWNRPMMNDARFVSLCAKLGLCDYWVGTGRWPDCSDEASATYDFKAEAVRSLAS